jgi:hypothetical protein
MAWIPFSINGTGEILAQKIAPLVQQFHTSP